MEDEALREKMILLGGLMSGLTHEIKTPLAAIRSNNEVLEEAFHRLEAFHRQSPDASIEALLSLVRDIFRIQSLACQRLDYIVRSVGNFTRSDRQAWTKTSLREILEDALALTAHALRGRIVVVKDFGEVEIDCHPNDLSQVFVNLLVNAAQAIEGAGEIRIQIRQEGDMAVVSISDTGSGMIPEVRARLFEAGFTTREKDAGAGLGLSICLKTVQIHHGKIEVQSQSGRGSTFVVSIPITQPSERKTNGER